MVEVLFAKYGESIDLLQSALKNKALRRAYTKLTAGAFDQQPDIYGTMSGMDIDDILSDHLRSEGITDVVISGCFDDSCVFKTAKGALEAWFDVLVDHDRNILLNAYTAVVKRVPIHDYITATEKL